MTELWLIIPAVIIFLLFLPIILEIKLSYNVLTNTGVISLYLFKKNLIYYIFEINGNHIALKNEDETIEKAIEFDSPELEFYKYLMKEIKEKVRLRFIDVFYNIGAGDAFLTSMLCGAVNTICLTIYSYIKNVKPTTSLGLYDTASYNRNEATIVFKGNLSITLFDLVYSLLLSVIITLKIKNKSLTI